MDILYGFPNKLIHNIGTKIMLDNVINRFLVYKDNEDDNVFDLPEIDNPIELLKDKKVFYGRRVATVLKEADISMYITLYDYRPYVKRYDKSRLITTTKIEIGIVCHDNCRNSLNGLREIAVGSRIIDIFKEEQNLGTIGRIELESFKSLYNMPVDYHGFQIILSAESEVSNNV